MGLAKQKQLETDRAVVLTLSHILSIIRTRVYLEGKILIGLPGGLNVKLDVVNIIFTVEIITFVQLNFLFLWLAGCYC